MNERSVGEFLEAVGELWERSAWNGKANCDGAGKMVGESVGRMSRQGWGIGVDNGREMIRARLSSLSSCVRCAPCLAKEGNPEETVKMKSSEVLAYLKKGNSGPIG